MSTAVAARIAPIAPADWADIRRIYEQGIATRMATFETSPPDWAEWDARHLPDHRLAARLDGAVLGWAALSGVSDRCFYAGVAENSVYVDETARGRGVGRLLLETLCARAEDAGIWTIQTRIFPENVASLGLHAACGFRVVGVRERIARMDGAWRDVLFLERRSSRI
jgi:L-amino acid N-acyltransferase YncA